MGWGAGLAERVDGVVGEGGEEALPALEVKGRHRLVKLPNLRRRRAGSTGAQPERPVEVAGGRDGDRRLSVWLLPSEIR